VDTPEPGVGRLFPKQRPAFRLKAALFNVLAWEIGVTHLKIIQTTKKSSCRLRVAVLTAASAVRRSRHRARGGSTARLESG
jgi:hypothetical protein